ncbi:hypothetical protein BU15DRAFT_83898 [Melanogaster broomeanus]|nr:hypothetical protein BU15DRAFT_83898 [Melanogaster broomeanus]
MPRMNPIATLQLGAFNLLQALMIRRHILVRSWADSEERVGADDLKAKKESTMSQASDSLGG